MSQTAEMALRGGSFLTENIPSDHITTPEDVTDEHQMIIKTTKDFVTAEVLPKLEDLENHDFKQASRLFQQAGELGLLGADVPEKYGGVELDQMGSAIITENFSLAQGFAVAHNIHVGVGTLPILYFGNEQQKQKYLPLIATGQMIAAYALTESGSGSDALSAKTTAVLNEEGTHYILNGEKQWITNASVAGIFIVFAKVNREDFTAFIVERETEGVSTGPEEKKMGIHSCSTATLVLDNVKVPRENVIWKVGMGHLVALNILNIARFKLGVMGVGQAKRALQLAAEYAKERWQFQKPIASFPLIQEKLADMAVHIYAAESSVYRTSGLLENKLTGISENDQQSPEGMAKLIGEYVIECAANKVFSSEMLGQVVDESLQIHGGYGFMSEYEIETMYRDARIDRIFEGTNEINRMAIGRALIKRMLKDKQFAEKMSSIEGSNELTENTEDPVKIQLLEKEKHLLHMATSVFRQTFKTAFHRYGKQLDNEQEILSRVADIIINIYAMGSVIHRTEKNVITGTVDQHQQKVLLTEVFCQESFEKILLYAKKINEHLRDKETQEKIRSNFLDYVSIDCIEKKRKVSEKIIEKEGYAV